MKRKITFLLAALLLMSGLIWAQTITWTAADQGYENGAVIESVTFDSNVSGTFNKGTNSNAPKYYTTGTAIRCYGGNYFTISTTAGNLTSIAMTFSTGEGTNAITTNVGSYENGTWSGEAQSVTFTIGGTSGHRRIASFTIDYSTAASTVPMPTFNPASGTEFGDEGLQVSIACATVGVDIFYTLDGSEPDDESTPYNGPISLTETTTIKAIAYDGDENSAVATATYTYVDPNAPGTENNPYTVAQARAAIDAGTGTQGVYATGIVSDIPTAYSTQYSNITFNMIDEEGDEDFLQAYRCGGDEAADVQIGDVVVVFGNLTKYNTTYEFGQGCTLVSLTHPTGYVEPPIFNPAAGTYDEAQTVTISCADANATIYYTLDGTEPTNASTQYTTAINVTTTTTIKAIAYVGTNASAVTTATYNIVSLANISDITEVGTAYEVQGTVVATNSRGFVMGDGTGYVYYYKNAAVSQSIGDMVKISGTTGTYGQIIQFTNTATVNEATTSNYNGAPAASVITEVPDYTQGYHLSTYLEFEGALTKSSNSYFITLGDAQIQISYPTSAQGTDLTALNGKTVHVKGYFAGINSSDKFTVMLESVEEVVSTESTITLDTYSIDMPAQGGEGNINVTYQNFSGSYCDVYFYAADGVTYATYDWITAELDSDYNVHYVVQANTGEARIAYFKVGDGAEIELKGRDGGLVPPAVYVYSDLVTVTQAAYVAPTYAELPFEFDGGKADIETTDGLYQEGLDDDYSSSPKLKFNTTGDYVLLQFQEEPGTLTFDIKAYQSQGSWEGTLTVMTSSDGISYTEKASYSTISTTKEGKIISDLASDVRYIKWIYTKVTGNVALGNIHLYEFGGGQTYDLTIEPFENLEIFTFVDDELTEPMEGAGTIQVTEGVNVMLSVSAEPGYVMQSLMVDGVEHVDDIDEGMTYTFVMPSHNVTITATAVEIIAPTDGDFVRISSLAQLTDGSIVVIASRYNADATNYYAMKNTVSGGKAQCEGFVSTTSNGNEILPASIVDNVNNFYWVANLTENGYTFTNANGDVISYNSSSNFNMNGTKMTWNVERSTSGDALVPYYEGFKITNVDTDNRCIAFRNTETGVFGPYSTQNITNNEYNFFLDFFVQTAASETLTQTVQLTEGTNWFSAYVDITLEDLQAALVAASSPNKTIVIKTQGVSTTYSRGRWNGTFDWDVASMYYIVLTENIEITLEGMPIDPAEHPITIKGNGVSNWIGYPFSQNMTATDAFSTLPPVNNDVVKAPGLSSTYSRGRWNGSMQELQPGQGYLYISAPNSTDRTFVYPTPSKEK